MYAPLFYAGRKFIVANEDLIFESWIDAVAAVSGIISKYKWSNVSWTYSVVDGGYMSRMRPFVFGGVGVMVMEDTP